MTGRALLLCGSALVFGCASSRPPRALVDARAGYLEVAAGPAARMAPECVRQAKDALDRAEQLQNKGPTDDVPFAAYVALRKGQTAQATGEALEAAELIHNADETIAQIERQRAELASMPATQPTPVALAAPVAVAPALAMPSALPGGTSSAAAGGPSGPVPAHVAKSDEPREVSERLAEVGTISREGSRTIVTFPARATFASGEAALSPSAVTRLDALVAMVGSSSVTEPMVVEVHANGGSSRESDLLLSQQRAEAVRSFLIMRGLDPDRIVARGVGPDRPIPGAASLGPAAGDQVEIVVPTPPSR